MSISGTQTEIEAIKKMAAEAGKSASRFLIEMAMGRKINGNYPKRNT